MTQQLNLFQAEFGNDIACAADASYLEEPRGRYHAKERVLLRPKTTENVARIVRFCADRGVGMIPYAGGTGLVGGQVAESGEMILLSLERMTGLRGIWPEEMVIR